MKSTALYFIVDPAADYSLLRSLMSSIPLTTVRQFCNKLDRLFDRI